MNPFRPARRPGTEPTSAFALAVAGLAPIAVGALLVTVRGELVTANLALIMVIVVVGAAVVGGRVGGTVAAVTAVVSYDFFLTEPYLSLRIDDADDLETAVLLLVIGLIVGQLVTIGRRRGKQAEDAQDEITRLHRISELAAGGARSDDLISAVEGELTALLGLDACHFETPPFGAPLPRLERNGAVSVTVRRLVGDDFALPSEGVELPVVGAGRQVGRLVFSTRPDVGVSLERRVVAVALSDQLGAALAPAAEGANPPTVDHPGRAVGDG